MEKEKARSARTLIKFIPGICAVTYKNTPCYAASVLYRCACCVDVAAMLQCLLCRCAAV